MKIEFMTAVPVTQRESVERLFFFNAAQSMRIKQIRVAVERYGAPTVTELDGKISLGVNGEAMQCLFACDHASPELKVAGVVLYLRPQADRLVIAHLAVSEAYTHREDPDAFGICGKLIEQVRRIAQRIKGVERIQLPYQSERFLSV